MTNTNYLGNDLSRYSDEEITDGPRISDDIESAGDFDDLDFSVSSESGEAKTTYKDSDQNTDNFFDTINPKEKNTDEEILSIPKSKIDLIQKLLKNINDSSEKINKLLSGNMSSEEERISIAQIGEINPDKEDDSDNKVIEGVFDGEGMIGPDGKQYSIPANYASKSKLVEGDMMKLTITPKGTFIYKQIGPTDRDRISGIIEVNQNGNFIVRKDEKTWRVLTASVTYYKGQTGDEAIILVPKNGESAWAAIDNIIKKTI